MKTFKTLATLLFTSSVLYAQDIPKNQVPSVVLNQFNIDFPKAKDIDWEMEGNIYHVDFELGWDQDVEAWYESNGKLIRLEEELSRKSELPQAVIATIEKNFQSYEIDDVEKITENKNEYYKIELEKGKKEITININKNGTLIK